MALKKIEQVKRDKGFRIFDLVIYGVVLLLVAALFITIFTTRNTDPLTGVKVTYRGQLVFEYEFSVGVTTLSEDIEMVEDDNGITLTIRSKDEYNVIYIDKRKKTAKMQDANCGRYKQCVNYYRELKNNSGSIICLPHNVTISPLVSQYDFIR